MQLKPQDFLVALKLAAWGEQRWTYARLAHELGISVSESHACIKRGLQAGLLVDTALLALPPEPAPIPPAPAATVPAPLEVSAPPPAASPPQPAAYLAPVQIRQMPL